MEVRKEFDQDPATLLHMSQLPDIDGTGSFARFAEHLDSVDSDTRVEDGNNG